MKRNFKKLLSVVLSLIMVFACFSSLGFTTLAEEATVVAKKGPFDFTDASDLAYGQGAVVKDGKLFMDIKSDYGAAWARFPFEMVNGTEYSVRFKVKLVSTANPSLTLKTAYAVDSGIGFTHTNSTEVAVQKTYTGLSSEWSTIEYSFTASLPSENQKYLGLFFQSSKSAKIYIDNLQITAKALSDDADDTPSSATYSFDDASDIDGSVHTWGANAPSVADSKLNITIPTSGNRVNVRFPFVLKEGETYSVKFDLTAKAANGFGIYVSYNTADSIIDQPTKEAAINNYSPTAGYQTTVTYAFRAEEAVDGKNCFGLLFWANAANVDLSIDNLEISVLDSASFDFLNASDIEKYAISYAANAPSVAGGKLNITIPTSGHRVNVRFPFILKEDETYTVKFDLTTNAANNFAIYASYNTAGSSIADQPYKDLLKSYTSIVAGETTTVKYTFTPNIPAEGTDRFGLLFFANAAGVDVSIDNLEIAVYVEPESASFDFSDASDLETYAISYNNGSAEVNDEKLDVTITANNNRVNTRFPFTLKDGKTYKVKLDVTPNASCYFGIYVSYNTANSISDNPSKVLINNYYYPAAETKISVEYEFTAAIPSEGTDRSGILFFANAAGVNISIDNLEITPVAEVDAEKAYYDFSDASHLEYGFISNNNGSVKVENGMLKTQITVANNRGHLKFPFKLQTGETYKVRFDVKADVSKDDEIYIAYAGVNNGDSTITWSGNANLITGGWKALTDEFQTAEYTFTANCPTGFENFGIFLRMGGAEGGNTIYIDNLYIVKDYLAPNTPNAPDIASHTENSVTLMDMVGYEYKLDDGEWQTSPVFTNLVQGQTYNFYQRAAASDIYGATAASEAFVYFIALYGDLDRDGDVLAEDLAILCQYILSENVEFDEFAADINKDGKINLLDFVALKKELAKKKIPVTPDFLGSNYKIAWNDEFEGTSIDSTKWRAGYYTTDNVFGGTTHIAYNDEDTLAVEDGYLKLNNKAVSNENGGYDYYTPEITTKNSYNFSYGYFEMRAKLTSGNPLWQSFWACGQNTEDEPYRAEIDVIETGATGANNGFYYYTVHSWWDKEATNLPEAMQNDTSGHKVMQTGTKYNYYLATDFHNYGCLWTEDSLTFYLDGVALKTVAFDGNTNSDYYKALIEGNPMFLVLGLSTARGTEEVKINNATLANQVMLVDYVRVYQNTAIGG